jgi:hydrogenase maturation protease
MTASPQLPQTTPHVLVIGVGNAYRGDDAVGQVVAQRVQEEHLEHVTVLLQSGEATRLLEAWQDAAAVILIDAAQGAARAGTVYRFEAAEQPLPRALWRCSTHAFGVAEGIELARALGQLPPYLVIYGIVGQTFAASAGLSAAVAQAVPGVVARVLQEIAALHARQNYRSSHA